MRRILIVLTMFFCGFCVKSQPPGSIIAGRYSSAYNRDFNDVFSSMNNQAALAEIRQVELGVCSERLFMSNDMNAYSLVLALPAFTGTIGLQSNYFGFSEYNASTAGIGYAKKLAEKINVGVAFNYFSMQVSGYGRSSTVFAQLGATCALNEQLSFGIHLFNPYGGKYGLGEKLPFALTTGIGYTFGKELCLSFEVFKEEFQKVLARILIHYKIHQQFSARLGLSTAVNNSFFALGYTKNKFSLGLAAAFHQQLGMSPALMASYSFAKEKE